MVILRGKFLCIVSFSLSYCLIVRVLQIPSLIGTSIVVSTPAYEYIQSGCLKTNYNNKDLYLCPGHMSTRAGVNTMLRLNKEKD